MKVLVRASAVLVLVATLAIPAVARAGDGKKALGLLPADTALVITVNGSRMKKAPLFAELAKVAGINPGVARALALLKSGAGVSIPADIKTAVVGLAADFDSSERTTVVIEAAIDAAKLANLASSYAKAVKKLTHNKTTYYRIDNVVEAVVLRGHLVLTNKGRAASLIDLAKIPNSKRLTTNKKMMAMVKAVDTRKDVWAVFMLPRKVRQNLGRSVPGGDSITSVSASFDVQNGMIARIRMGSTKASTATAIVTAVRLGKATLAGHAKVTSLGLSAAVKAVSASRTGNNADVVMRMTAAELKKLGGFLGSI